jgi:hypothetical protein
LTNEVGADGKTLQIVFVQNVPAALDIGIAGEGFVNFEMVSPTGKFKPVKTPGARLFCNIFQSKVSPLAGKESDWSAHFNYPF